MNVAQGGSYDDTFGPIYDGAGAIVTTGVSANKLTASVYDALNVNRSSSAALSYVGAGIYRIVVTTGAAGAVGTWAVAVTWNDGVNTPQHFADSFDVVAAGTLTTGVAPATSVDATATNTRLAIRRQVSDLLGDLKIATASGTGSTTTFIDVDDLSGPANAYAGREAYFTGGTSANLGKKRFITASASTGTLTFAALPSATAAGDEIELRNLRNAAWGVDELHRAINMAISDASVGFWSISRETLAAAFSATTPTLTIPAAYAYIYMVEYQDRDGFWREIQPANSDDVPGWRVVRGQRVIDINGDYWISNADTAAVRISGYQRYAALTLDTDTTPINAEWLRYQAAAYLLLQGRERAGDNSRLSLSQAYQGRADRLRDLVSGVPANNTAAVL